MARWATVVMKGLTLFLSAMRKQENRVATLDLRRANFKLPESHLAGNSGNLLLRASEFTSACQFLRITFQMHRIREFHCTSPLQRAEGVSGGGGPPVLKLAGILPL